MGLFRLFRLTFLVLFISGHASAQTSDSLRQKIQQIVSAKKAVVGIAILGPQGTLFVNGGKHFPLQSVFKLHIAMAVLSQIDKGRFSLDQKIKIDKKDMLPGLYSPIRDEHPNGVTLTIAEILSYMVSKSDNVGCDVLLKLIGGPQVVEDYFIKNHFKDVSIKVNEEVQQANWDRQFENWTTPKAANELLAAFYSNKRKLLSQKSYDLIWKIMRGTETGTQRLKGGLPAHTVVAHKTGSSGANEKGLTAAVNDIGIIFLPDGRYYFISVFVTNSKEDAATNEKIIADISKATWEYFTVKGK